MSVFDKRREQLGLKAVGGSSKASSGGTSSSGSAFDRRREQLNKDKEKKRQDSIKKSERSRQEPSSTTKVRERMQSTLPKRESEILERAIPSFKTNPFEQSQSLDNAIRPATLPQSFTQSTDETPTQSYLRQQAEKRDAQDPKNPILKAIKDNTVDALGERIDQFLVGDTNYDSLNTVGKFVNRLSRGMGDIQNVDVESAGAAPKLSTGSKIADAAADFGGNIAGSVVDPSNIAGGFLQRTAEAGKGVAQTFAPKANKYVQKAISGAVEGGLQGAALSGTRGETNLADMGRNIGMGLGGGAIADPLLSVATKGLQRGLTGGPKFTPEPKVTSEYKEPWFNKLFGSQSMGITPGSNGKALIDTHIVRNAKEGTPLIDKVEDLAANTNTDYVDRFAAFKQIDKDTYNAAMDSTRANNLANVTIKDKFVDLEGNVIGKSLKDVYINVPRGMKDIADRYTIMRDAVSRMDRGLAVYADKPWFPKTADEAAKMVQELEARNPWLKQFGEDWNQFNRNRQDLWVKSGIVSEDLINTLRHTNPNYAPMMRQRSAASLKGRLAFNSNKSGFSGQRAPIKRAVGSTKKIIEPAQGMIDSTAASYNAMMRNRAMTKLYEAVKSDPEKYKGIIEIVDDTAEARQASLKAINDALQENGPDGVASMLNDEIDKLFKKSQQASSKGDAVVTVMMNGNPVKLKVLEKNLIKGIEGVAPEQLEGVVKVFNVLSRGIKQSATGMLAPLQGAKLAIRDLPIAFAQSKDKKMFIPDISHAAISQIADWLPSFVPGAKRVGNLAREYYRAGGGYEAYLKGDSKIRAVSSDLTRDPILSGRNMLKTAKQINPFKPLKALGDAMENIPRIAAFSAQMRKTGWSRDPESIRAAVDAGREATVNWSRRGHKGSVLESVLPYSNAAVQGTYRVAKRFREQPISAMALILSVAGAKIAAYEKFKDDPDYQHRSRFEKGIPVAKTADGKFRTVPVEPTEAYIADQILHFYKWATEGEKAPGLKENLQEGINAFTPKYVAGPAAAFTTEGKAVDIPSAVSSLTGGSVFEPVGAVVSGKNFFGGDVVPREYQDLPRNLQHNETTSAAGKWAAENLGIDAFTFDYLGQKFGGDIAKIALPMTSEVGKGDPTGNMLDETLTRLKLLEDPVMKNRISEDFYNYARSVTQAKAANGKADVALPSWYQAAYDEVTSTKKGSIASQVSDLTKSKKEVERNLNLSAKQRADKLRDIQRDINYLRIQGMKRLEQLGVPKTKE